MGTGVMIGAGIFALTGQVAELAGPMFPLAFLIAAVITGFSAYSYIKVSNKYPSAGGVAMILSKAYGPSTATGAGALLMAVSMIINESLVARTFGTYTLQVFEFGGSEIAVPILAVGLILFAFIINISGNKYISTISAITAFLKIGGILLFSVLILWKVDFRFGTNTFELTTESGVNGFIAGVALAILAYKGFTTITNSGGEVTNPEKNIGRAIVISIVICVIVYLIVVWAVTSSISISEIIRAKDYSIAEAARPYWGDIGVWFTVFIAIVATSSGVLASVFAVSRMLAMLTDMKLIPHRHFGMPGGIQKHTLVYTVVLASFLAAFFDLTRIASLGVIFYLSMDITVHFGVLKYLKTDVGAKSWILITAIIFDVCVLGAFILRKFQLDPFVVYLAVVSVLVFIIFEKFYLSKIRKIDDPSSHNHTL